MESIYLKLLHDDNSIFPPYLPIFIRQIFSDWKLKSLKGVIFKILKEYNEQIDIPMLLFIDGYDELQMESEKPTNVIEYSLEKLWRIHYSYYFFPIFLAFYAEKNSDIRAGIRKYDIYNDELKELSPIYL